eukprot:TRINITY_DN3621_c0_g4_i2.p1 TRINITY_DN3621_c0_g4~~TRINITY_DN3621_c0_g4_i2.p1  ORF type:complete len:573 (-),score=155.18 TRINITY_DN3621_c0_g4_i2:41-1759(-)
MNQPFSEEQMRMLLLQQQQQLYQQQQAQAWALQQRYSVPLPQPQAQMQGMNSFPQPIPMAAPIATQPQQQLPFQPQQTFSQPLPPCLLSNCPIEHPPGHKDMFQHPCRHGSSCRKQTNAVHLRRFSHGSTSLFGKFLDFFTPTSQPVPQSQPQQPQQRPQCVHGAQCSRLHQAEHAQSWIHAHPVCQFGAVCTLQKDVLHRDQWSHVCKYGTNCRKKDEVHLRRFAHNNNIQQPQQQPQQQPHQQPQQFQQQPSFGLQPALTAGVQVPLLQGQQLGAMQDLAQQQQLLQQLMQQQQLAQQLQQQQALLQQQQQQSPLQQLQQQLSLQQSPLQAQVLQAQPLLQQPQTQQQQQQLLAQQQQQALFQQYQMQQQQLQQQQKPQQPQQQPVMAPPAFAMLTPPTTFPQTTAPAIANAPRGLGAAIPMLGLDASFQMLDSQDGPSFDLLPDTSRADVKIAPADSDEEDITPIVPFADTAGPADDVDEWASASANVIGHRTKLLQAIRDAMTCPVCRGRLMEPVTLSCTHDICESCFTVSQRQCPVCRQDIVTHMRSTTLTALCKLLDNSCESEDDA